MVFPHVTERLPYIVDAPRVRAVVPLSKVTWLEPPATVVNVTAPVKALVVVLKVMTLFVTLVVKLEVPVTVNAAVWVIALPEVTVRMPFTVCPARAMAAVVVRVKLPSVVKAARLIAVEPLFNVMGAAFVPAV